ncbi:MAG: 3-oxoacyl-ACP synthase [Bacteroidia bacterium]|nr:3-oxoacyl-ACP synthase [Bacteroidia bacterium]
MNIVKKHLFDFCVDFVNHRSDNINQIIASNKNSLASETKSSAGDKHETGRAMLQLEMEKASQQLAGLNEMKLVLNRINISESSIIVKLGSVAITTQGNYFLAISAGKISYLDKIYYAVSVGSPIGKMLLGKAVGSNLDLNSKSVTILGIY